VEERRRFVAEILGVAPDAIPWKTEPSTTIEFRSLEQFDNARLAFVNGQQQEYRATADALVAKDVMTAAESEESLPKLELRLNDLRGENGDPIPEPAYLPPNVEWKSAAWN